MKGITPRQVVTKVESIVGIMSNDPKGRLLTIYDILMSAKQLHAVYVKQLDAQQGTRNYYDLGKAEERHMRKIERGAEIVGVDVYYQTDPRGLPVYLLPQGLDERTKEQKYNTLGVGIGGR